MSTIVSSTSSTIVSLLGTIDVTAKAVTQSVGILASSVDMLDTYVQRAKTQQRQRHVIEDQDWLQTLKEDAALARVKRTKELAAQLDETQRAELNQHISRYDALFATEKGA